MGPLSLLKSRLTRNPIRSLVIVVLTVGAWHTLSQTGAIPWTGIPDAAPVRLLPASPHDIPPPITRPILVSRPHSSDSTFTRHVHQYPYPGIAHHLTSTIHPSKDNQTHYLLGSVWYFEQKGNLDWVKQAVQAILPTSAKYIRFTCEYQRGGRGPMVETEAFTIMQGRKEYMHVECALPPWVKVDTTMSEKQIRKALDLFSKDRTYIKVWLEMGNFVEDEKDKWLSWRTKPLEADAITRQESGATYVSVASQELSAGDWTPSGPPNKLGICLSPIHLQSTLPDSTKLVNQLKEMLEWRIWHAFGGVEVVHWSARDGNVGHWVKALNRILGLHDTYLTAPQSFNMKDGHRVKYADQLMYLADCLMRHGVTDEWQSMTDLDEYLLARDDPNPYWIARRLELAPKTVGTFAIDQTYHGSDRIKSTDSYAPPRIEQFPAFPRNGYKDWDTMEKANGFRAQKSMYRTAAVKSIWVHSHTELGEGYWKTSDIPGIAPDKGDYPSQIELLHDRAELPAKLVIEKTSPEGAFDAWTKTWEDMAKVLRKPELAELWDPLLIKPR